jgi:hypothetical protein
MLISGNSYISLKVIYQGIYLHILQYLLPDIMVLYIYSTLEACCNTTYEYYVRHNQKGSTILPVFKLCLQMAVGSLTLLGSAELRVHNRKLL